MVALAPTCAVRDWSSGGTLRVEFSTREELRSWIDIAIKILFAGVYFIFKSSLVTKKVAAAKRNIIASIPLFIGLPIVVVNANSRLTAPEMTIGQLTSHALAACCYQR